ncbi:hypothetical protein H1D32_11100 [Anaerobacillus sp. CMMVII]|uniref:hypothetical protein n=1 Tax=Anaerobacillus sp. CMMVII TaxID=2755588 RepID=UPI0021B79B41|nr:hypothetical protein [Anaerobacillus sp. CMMVII]MCT8138249.1 hypothetical protein [Anaerobacillus sp. CMMVII]
MFSKYFGNFLLNKGIITSNQLNEVFQEEKQSHVKLGILALNKGFMTLEQINEVNEAQRATDRRFGEIAIQREYLSIDKLEELLTDQKTSYLLISQILLDKNLVTMDQISKLLFSYKNEYGLTNEDLQELTNDNVEKIIESSLNLEKPLSDYIVMLVKNIERHFHEKAYVQELKNGIDRYPLVAYQQIVGEYNLDTYLMLSEPDFLKVASIFAEEELKEIDELSISAVLEFLNLHNGIFIVNEVDKGFDLSLLVQKLVEPSLAQEEVSYFTILFSDIELIVGLQKR